MNAVIDIALAGLFLLAGLILGIMSFCAYHARATYNRQGGSVDPVQRGRVREGAGDDIQDLDAGANSGSTRKRAFNPSPKLRPGIKKAPSDLPLIEVKQIDTDHDGDSVRLSFVDDYLIETFIEGRRFATISSSPVKSDDRHMETILSVDMDDALRNHEDLILQVKSRIYQQKIKALKGVR